MSKIYYLVRQRQKKTEKCAGLGLRERIVDVCAQDPLRVEFCRRIKRDDAFRLKTLGWKERSADEYVRMYKSRAKVGKFIKSEDQMMTTELYELGHIEAKLSRGRNKVTVLMKDGKTRTIDTTVHNDPPLVCTYDHQHDGHVDKIPDDVSNIQGFGEAALLRVMKRRFLEKLQIYTYVGDIVLCINPYVSLPAMEDIAEPPNVKRFELGRDPHSYATAHFAYWNQRDPDQYPSRHRDQSCVVSGESGAGKTVACGLILQYLSKLSQWRSDELKLPRAKRDVTKRIGGVSPFLEAFGNAKTGLNDNSSRFGKFMKILFHDGMIVGGNAESYLLEKSRLAMQSANERNFHIFYMLCAGATKEERRTLNLKEAHEYACLTKGCKPGGSKLACVTVEHETKEDGTNTFDFDRMNDPLDDDFPSESGCRVAMTDCGIDATQQMSLWRVIAAILKLGEIDFVEVEAKRGGETLSTVAQKSRPICDEIAKLLGLDHLSEGEGLGAMLCVNRIRVLEDGAMRNIDSGQIPSVCSKQRDALAKDVYSRCFDFMFRCVNRILKPTRSPEAFIGILDIFGFEVFDRNGMDQLFINFANEKLQKIFNDHVFQREKVLYELEGIPKEIIPPYRDNTPCCDLIERTSKGFVGLLPSLDEKSTKATARDDTWCGQVLKKWGRDVNVVPETCKTRASQRSAKYIHGKKGAGNDWFSIRHFAGDVKYWVRGFLEKNNDKFPIQLPTLMRKSSCQFVKNMYDPKQKQKRKGEKKPKFGTIGCKFVGQLRSLAATLGTTTPHYVRCVKPNDVHMRPVDGVACFDAYKTYRQLLYAGVMEVCRIKKDGYPFRETFDHFWQRRVLANRWNRFMVPQISDDTSPVEGIKKIFAHVLPGLVKVGKRGEEVDRPQWCVGTTQIFAKDYALARIDDWAQRRVIKTIHRWWRVNALARRVREFQRATIRIQTVYRRILKGRKYGHLVGEIQYAYRSYRNYDGWRSTIDRIRRLEDVRRSAVAVQRSWINYRAGAEWSATLVLRRKLSAAASISRAFVSRALHREWVETMKGLRCRLAADRVMTSWKNLIAYRTWTSCSGALRRSFLDSVLEDLYHVCAKHQSKQKFGEKIREKLHRLRRFRIVQQHVRRAIANGSLRRKQARLARQQSAATVALSLYRSRRNRVLFVAAHDIALICQTLWRGYCARRRFYAAKRALVRFQSQFRRFRIETYVSKRIAKTFAVQTFVRRIWIERKTKKRRAACNVVELAMYRHLLRRRLKEWIEEMQSAVASGNMSDIRLLMSCPNPYVKLRPMLQERLRDDEKPYNALVNLRDRAFFDSFLHIAVGAPNGAVVAQYLLAEGADPEAANFRGSTVLHDSAGRGDDCIALTEVLLRKCSTLSVCNRDLLYVLSFECNRYVTSRERRDAMASAMEKRYSLSERRKWIHNGEPQSGETVLGAAIHCAYASERTVKLLRAFNARASGKVKKEQREQEMCVDAWKHEDAEAEREKDRRILEELKRSGLYKLLELAMAKRNWQNTAIGVSRIMRFIREWRQRKGKPPKESVFVGEDAVSPRARTTTAAMIMGEVLDSLDDDDRRDRLLSRHMSVHNINQERTLSDARQKAEEWVHLRNAATSLKDRLKKRNEWRKNRRREHARARAISAHQRYSGPLLSERREESSATFAELDGHDDDLFGSKLDLIGDGEEEMHKNGVAKDVLESVLPSDQSYHYRKYMTKHRISTILQEIPDDIIEEAAKIDEANTKSTGVKEEEDGSNRGSVWMALTPDRFESTLPSISSVAPLDPPGMREAIDDSAMSHERPWAIVPEVVDDEEDASVPRSPAFPPGIPSDADLGQRRTSRMEETHRVMSVPDSAPPPSPVAKPRGMSESTSAYIREAMRAEPRYRGNSVFAGMKDISPTKSGASDGTGDDDGAERENLSSELVWSNLLRPQFCDSSLKEASFPVAPPGHVRPSSDVPRGDVMRLSKLGGNVSSVDPPGKVRRSSKTTKQYILESPSHSHRDFFSEAKEGNAAVEGNESNELLSISPDEPPGNVRRSSVATKAYLLNSPRHDASTSAPEKANFVKESTERDGGNGDAIKNTIATGGDKDEEKGDVHGDEDFFTASSEDDDEYDTRAPPGMMSEAKTSSPYFRNPLMDRATREYVDKAKSGRPVYRGGSVFEGVMPLFDPSEEVVESTSISHSMGPRRPSAIALAVRVSESEDLTMAENHENMLEELTETRKRFVPTEDEEKRVGVDIESTRDTTSESDLRDLSDFESAMSDVVSSSIGASSSLEKAYDSATLTTATPSSSSRAIPRENTGKEQHGLGLKDSASRSLETSPTRTELFNVLLQLNRLSAEPHLSGWQYRDAKDKVYGPFSTAQMRYWFVKSRLSENVLVRYIDRDPAPDAWNAPFCRISCLFVPTSTAFDVSDSKSRTLAVLQRAKRLIKAACDEKRQGGE